MCLKRKNLLCHEKKENEIVEEPTERVIGKLTPSEKKELKIFAIENEKDIEEIVREGVLNEIKKKILACLRPKIILLVYSAMLL